MMSLVALEGQEIMPSIYQYSELHVDEDMRCNQGHRGPDAPWKVDSYGQEAGETGRDGHGAVDGMAS